MVEDNRWILICVAFCGWWILSQPTYSDIVYLCSQGCPRSPYVDQAGLKSLRCGIGNLHHPTQPEWSWFSSHQLATWNFVAHWLLSHFPFLEMLQSRSLTQSLNLSDKNILVPPRGGAWRTLLTASFLQLLASLFFLLFSASLWASGPSHMCLIVSFLFPFHFHCYGNHMLVSY